MNNARLALGLLFATAGGATAAHAQVTADTMVGGSVEREVDIRARAAVLYDSNITHQSDLGATLQGIHASDTVFTPSLVGRVILPVGRQAVYLSGSASYNFHDKNPQLDHSQWNVNAGGGGRFGPCGAGLGGSFTQGRSELDDYTLVARAQNVATTERVNVSLTCVRPPGIGVFVTAEQAWGQNSLDQLQGNEYESTNVSGGVVYGTPTRLSVSLIGSYSTTDYPHRTDILQSDGYESWSAGVRLERQLGARIQGALTVSYTSAESKGGPVLPILASTKFEGTTYAGSLSYRASSRLTFLGDFDRSVNPTLIQGGSYQLQTNYSLRADYRLGSRVLVGVGALQKESDAKGTSILVPNQLTESRTRIALATLRYRQSPRLSFTLNGQYEKREADNAQFNYSGERVGLAADLSF
jgi:putative beta-barrel porin BBP2